MGEVNWAQLVKDAGDTSPVPIGKYDAICVKAELKKAQASGNEYWATQWKIQSGPSTGRTLFNNFVLVEDNPNALRAFFINLRNLGITTEHLTQLGADKNALTPMFVTRQAVLTVGHRPYNGQMRENVERVDPHPNGPIGSLANAGAPAANGMAPAVPQANVPVAPIPQMPAPTQAVPNPTPIPAPAPMMPTPMPAPQPAAQIPAAPPIPQPAPVAPAPAPAPAAVPDDQAAAFAAWMASQQAAAAPAPAPAPTPQAPAAPVPPAVPF